MGRKRGGGGGSGDVLAKVTAGNAVCVRRSKVVCRVAELASFSFPSLSPSPSLERSPACCLSCSSHRRGAAAQTAGMHQMHRTDRCPSRSTGFHLFTSVARARVFLSSLPWRSSSPPPSTLPRRALLPPRFTRTRETVPRYYFSCSLHPLSPPPLFLSICVPIVAVVDLPPHPFLSLLHPRATVHPFALSRSLSLSLSLSASRPTVFLRSRQPSYLFSLRRNVIGISPHSLPLDPFLLRMTGLLFFSSFS